MFCEAHASLSVAKLTSMPAAKAAKKPLPRCNTLEEAAKAGDLDELKRLRGTGRWDAWVCYWAAKGGHLECLTYAHRNRCPWERLPSAIQAAVEGGHLECLAYAHENGCPWPLSSVFDIAAESGHLECLQYLHENGCPWPLVRTDCEGACAMAARGGHVECLRYLHDIGFPFDINGRWWIKRKRGEIGEGSHAYFTLDDFDLDSTTRARMEAIFKCPIKSAMAVLDEVKEGMSDGNYKTIADGLMHAHRAKRARE